MIRRIAFVSGLVLGSGICAFALGAMLTYLFTGQVISISMGEGRGIKRMQSIRLNLFDMHTLREAPPTLTGEGGL